MSFQRIGNVDEEGDPDIVYFNSLIINNRTNITADLPDPPVKFNETRVQPIINDASKFNFSIIRANINGANKSLPMFLPSIRIGPVDNPTSNVNLTIYSITLRINIQYNMVPTPIAVSLERTEPIIWRPEVLDTNLAPVPLASTTQTFQDVGTQYYWCSTYSHWLSLVNETFRKALANIQTQFNAAFLIAYPASTPPRLQTVAPYMTYNPTNNLFSLYVPRASFSADLAAGGVANTTPPTTFGTTYQETAFLWFNQNMNGLFTNFKVFYQNQTGSERDYLLSVPNINFQNILSISSPPAPVIVQPVAPGVNPPYPVPPNVYWIMIQDYPSTSTLWSPCESIVFTTTMLPIVYEEQGNPVQYGNSNTGLGTQSEAAFAPIITDISLYNESSSDYREFIQYIPSAEYRLASLGRSKTPIQNIDVQIFWKNRLDGQLYPLNMYNGSSVSIKMMFRKRGVYDFPHDVRGYK